MFNRRDYLGKVTDITIPRQRAVINRRALLSAIAKSVAEKGAEGARADIVVLFKQALSDGRTELVKRLIDKPSAGHENSHGYAFLVDQIIRVMYDHVTDDLLPNSKPSRADRIALMAVGGYGRGEMSPHSDVDIAFVTPAKPTKWCEKVIESMLYFLWDLGLTIGHSSRSIDELVRMAKDDLTIRTATLEGRYLWGDQDVYEQASARFWSDVVTGSEADFVHEKLAERDGRHTRMGDSRYVVEPNVKDGKGGLRDLQTLYWIGKYIYRVRSAAELVEKNLFTKEEYRTFRKAENFLLAVRAHLHTITNRPEDRLTFDLQREVAKRMNFAERPGKSPVERFMQYYFMQAQAVGHLSGVFLSQVKEELDEKNKAAGFLASLFSRGGSTETIDGYLVEAGRLAAPGDDWFTQDPVRLIEIFRVAEREGLEIHPATTRMIRRDSGLIQRPIRRDKRANALFLELLAGRKDPETALRWMNEAGVFGRFIPDFGKVNAQMQFDMYHHYTVDEHTIRAIGLLSKIERGELNEDHPLAVDIFPRLAFRNVLYVATLLHDIAKGRGGDHSVLGAELALRICPRLGLTDEETQLVSWLVRQHLQMSATAFKRDLADPKTIGDFAETVENMERLRQLSLLTIVDIRAVGPGIWNSWKRQLLTELYQFTQDHLRHGGMGADRQDRIVAKRARVAELLGDKAHMIKDLDDRFDEDYWLAEPDDIIAINIPHYASAKDGEHKLSIHAQYYPARGATLVTVIGDDHPGLIFRIAGAIHLAGGNIIDARIHTTSVGKAVDNFLVQDPLGKPFQEEAQIARLKQAIEDALYGKIELMPQLAKRPLARARAEHFTVRPNIVFDNNASRRFTVIEVNAADRPALLCRLTRALYEGQNIIHSAHMSQYGERVVDIFYVTDLLGGKLTSQERIDKVENALLDAIAAGEPDDENSAAD